MKRLLILSALMISVQAMGQKSAIQTAYNWLRYQELDKAKEAIDGAVLNETTRGVAKAWYYRGSIYQSIYESTNEKFKSLKPGSLAEARKSYEEAVSLDTKKEFTDDIMKRMEILAFQSLNEGVDLFKVENYRAAMQAFGMSAEINQKLFNRVDTMGIYNRALAAEKAGESKVALDDFTFLTSVNYGGARIFSLLANMHLDQKDTVSALDILTKGQEKYPDDRTLITQALNIYLSSGRDQEAYAKNEQAIAASPTNSVLYYIKGNLADKMGKKEESISAYKKAIELKPDYFDANYNLGAMFFNDGAEMANQANKIPTSKQAEYDAAKKKFDAKFQEALPYLEKAHKLNPEDMGTMQSLRQLYTRLGDLTKAGEMKRKMESKDSTK